LTGLSTTPGLTPPTGLLAAIKTDRGIRTLRVKRTGKMTARASRGIDRTQRRRQLLAVLPTGMIEAVAGPMNNTRLQCGPRIYHLERLVTHSARLRSDACVRSKDITAVRAPKSACGGYATLRLSAACGVANAVAEPLGRWPAGRADCAPGQVRAGREGGSSPSRRSGTRRLQRRDLRDDGSHASRAPS
jgi:hypothetical protein